MGFPGGSVVKNLLTNAGNISLIPGFGSPLEKEMATHPSCLGNPMDRGTCQAIVHGVAKESDIIYQLNSNNIRDYHTFNDLTQMYYFTVFIGQEYRHKLARSTAQGLTTLKSKCCPGL